jgi:hypothetical protein
MNKRTILLSVLILLAQGVILCGCGSDENKPLPAGQVPEWKKNNMKSSNHPKDPNLPAGEK